MTAWTAEDIRVASLLEAQLGPIRVIEVIEHKENRMTDTVAPDVEAEGWEPEDGAAFGGATYPEYPYSLADHAYTWSPKLSDGSMLVIRSQTAEGLAEAAEAVAPLAGRLRAAWAAVVGQPAAPANQFPSQTAPPFGPNVSVPQAPGFQGPPQVAAPQWGAPQPQGGFGGGQVAKTGPKPRPAWPQVYKINVPFAAKDQFKAFRNDNQDALKGKVAWAGGGDYWIEGSVAQGFAQYNPMPA